MLTLLFNCWMSICTLLYWYVFLVKGLSASSTTGASAERYRYSSLYTIVQIVKSVLLHLPPSQRRAVTLQKEAQGLIFFPTKGITDRADHRVMKNRQAGTVLVFSVEFGLGGVAFSINPFITLHPCSLSENQNRMPLYQLPSRKIALISDSIYS